MEEGWEERIREKEGWEGGNKNGREGKYKQGRIMCCEVEIFIQDFFCIVIFMVFNFFWYLLEPNVKMHFQFWIATKIT